MSDGEMNTNDAANRVQLELEDEVCIPIQTPLVMNRPRLRRARSPVAVHSLRRSGRIAARSRAANATAQAQRVLLKKLGIVIHDAEPDNDIQQKFKNAFAGNMSLNKRHALQLFLQGGIDLAAMRLDLDGVEEEAQ